MVLVPMPHRGPRMQLTVRLPLDEYREVAVRAQGRGWSMSDYIAYCVARTLGTRKVHRATAPGVVNSSFREFPDEPEWVAHDPNEAPR